MEIEHHVVYLLSFPNSQSNKQYVGFTKNIISRMKSHMYYASRGKNRALHNAIRKYGKPSIEILHEVSSREEAGNFEIQEIIRLGTFHPGGYNLTLGGDGVAGQTREQYQKNARKAQAGMTEEQKEIRRAKKSKYLKDWWADPKNKARRSKSIKSGKGNMSPEAKKLESERKSKAAKAQWEDPSIRSKMLKSLNRQNKHLP